MKSNLFFCLVAFSVPSIITADKTLPLNRAHALVLKMNQTEKFSMVCGVWGLGYGPEPHVYVGNVPALSRVGIPWLSLQDGPQVLASILFTFFELVSNVLNSNLLHIKGYRDGKYGHYGGAPGTSTQWPSGLTVAATFDPTLAYHW